MGYPIGDFISLLATLSYALPVYYLLNKAKTKTAVIMALLTGTLVLTVVLSIANWFTIITPLYMYLLNFEMGSVKELVLGELICVQYHQRTCRK